MRHIWKLIPLVLIACFFMTRQAEVPSITTTQSEQKTVEVKGAVHQPGVYEVAWNATIEDVLKCAGGARTDADLSSINQTRNLEQGEVLIIPIQKQETCISINSASKEELDTLPGIGEKIAQRILDERAKEPFHQLEDIKRVKGIGDKLFEKMKGQICL